MLSQYPIKPSIWLRCVVDIFMIWNDSEDKLKDFLAHINTVNPAIQFTHAHSFKSANFLDVYVTLTNDGTNSTDLYTKPTNTHQYLHMNSCHPNHVEKPIAFSQATRIIRICCDPATAQSRCNELIEYHIIHHSFADDLQLQMSAPPDKISELLHSMQSCISDVKAWATANMLKLNDSKTELMLVTSKRSKLLHNLLLTYFYHYR